ncbi:hypothetical protein RI367_000087 [Sorochytrium milnesiophthora]
MSAAATVLPATGVAGGSGGDGNEGLEHIFRWRIQNWSELQPCTEYRSPNFAAEDSSWLIRVYKGVEQNSQAFSIYLHCDRDSLYGIKKFTRLTFCLSGQKKHYGQYGGGSSAGGSTGIGPAGGAAGTGGGGVGGGGGAGGGVVNAAAVGTAGISINTSATGHTYGDFVKIEQPVWFSESHSTWGEACLMELNDVAQYVREDSLHIYCKIEVLRVIGDFPLARINPYTSFFNSPQLSDVQLAVHPGDSVGDHDPTTFYAHKTILSMQSPYFLAMFSPTSSFREHSEARVSLLHFDPHAFELALRWIYGAEVQLRGEGVVTLERVLEVAERCQIHALREECLRHLRLAITYDALWHIWSVAERYQSEETIQQCRAFAARNFETLRTSVHQEKQPSRAPTPSHHPGDNADPAVLLPNPDASPATASATPSKAASALLRLQQVDAFIIQQVISLAEMNADCEEHVYEFLIDWCCGGAQRSSQRQPPTASAVALSAEGGDAEHASSSNSDSDMGERVAHAVASLSVTSSAPGHHASALTLNEKLDAMVGLLQHVRFPLMEKQYLIEVVEPNAMVMNIPGTKDLLLEAYRFLLTKGSFMFSQLQYAKERITPRRKVTFPDELLMMSGM